ncbi:hypothetical protein ACFQBY_03410 [Promicromonospora citrea]|uniref:Secreted protein n=1 Tax=Promicromonospora citrea TaxID=43677 RepID=A0A8H9GHU5_9MICO|nr:hypothetical protein [Promicromonospora citrea]NNH52778.1 hypothetical protein [Promicromonospora citrea]GGM29628.1 hypothetical protein GCM10010102_26490 [Promicromonospora citrea]
MNLNFSQTGRLSRVLVGAAALGAVVATSLALTSPAVATQSGVAADERPPHAVEDFNYPGADRVLAEQGFEVRRGDGHIVVADCATEDVLRISTYGDGFKCFRTTGDSGWITLAIDRANGVRTNSATSTHLELTSESGDEQVYDVAANDWEAIGSSDQDSGGEDFTLLEIRVTR